MLSILARWQFEVLGNKKKAGQLLQVATLDVDVGAYIPCQ